jgi:O-antigen ligase
MPPVVGAARTAADGLPAAAVAGGAVAILSLASGGGSPAAWDVTSVVALAVALAIIWRHRPVIGRMTGAAVGLLALMAAWSGLSYLWSADPPATAGEVQRWVATAALAGCIAVAARAWSPRSIPAGLAASTAIVCSYAIATKMLPGWFGQGSLAGINRLYQPVGYWNALGVLAAIGIVLVAGLAAHGSDRARSTCAAAAVPLVAALYLTFSRGALLALVVGLIAMLGLESRRLDVMVRALAIAPAALIALAMLQLFPALAAAHPPYGSVVRQGRYAMLLMVAAALTGAWIARRWGRVAAPMLGSADARRRSMLAACALVLVLAVGLVLNAGGPAVVIRALGSAGEPSPHFKRGDLNLRLLSLSPNGRGEIWRVAWTDALDHPLLGSGDGSYAQRWLRFRSEPDPAVAAHSLFLETAAELGLVGFTILAAWLCLPFLAARRARSLPMAPALAGAVAGCVAQMAVDWTWDVTAVAAAVIGCVVALCSAADGVPRRSVGWAVPLVWAAAVALPLAAFCLVGNVELSRAQQALRAGSYGTAAGRADLAASLAPWSSASLQIASYAAGKHGDPARSRAQARRGAQRAPGEWWFWFRLACLDSARQRPADLSRARHLNPRAVELVRFPKRCGEPLAP